MLKIAKSGILALGIALALPVVAAQASDGADEAPEIRGVTKSVTSTGTVLPSTTGGFVEPDSLR